MIKKLNIFIFLFFSVTIINSQNTTIPEAAPFCSDTGILFDNTSNGSNAEFGPDYGCLGSQPNPSWFYIRINEPGTLTLEIEQNSQADFNGCQTGSNARADATQDNYSQETKLPGLYRRVGCL